MRRVWSIVIPLGLATVFTVDYMRMPTAIQLKGGVPIEAVPTLSPRPIGRSVGFSAGLVQHSMRCSDVEPLCETVGTQPAAQVKAWFEPISFLTSHWMVRVEINGQAVVPQDVLVASYTHHRRIRLGIVAFLYVFTAIMVWYTARAAA